MKHIHKHLKPLKNEVIFCCITSFAMFSTLFVLFSAVLVNVDGYRVNRSTYSGVFDDTITCIPSIKYYTLVFWAIMPISGFISFWITSHLYRRNLLAIIGAAFNGQEESDTETETETEEETPEETPDEKYVKLYPIKRATHDPPKFLDELKYTIMVETTPRGTLLMCYNYEMDAFEYWSDSNIPFTMLETSARRYVTEYNCKEFYLPRKKVDNDEDVIERETASAQEPENDLYVKRREIDVIERETASAQEDEPEQEPEQETAQETAPEQETAQAQEPEDDVFIKRKKTDAQLKLEKQLAEEEPVTRCIKKGRLTDFKPKELFKGMNFDEQVVKKTLNYETFKKAMAASAPSREDYVFIRNACDSGMF